MNKQTHTIYISTLVGINLIVLSWLIYKGYSYYSTPVVDRFFHKDHASLKPSGPFGHGYGIIGTLLILIGVFGYIARKKYRSLAQFGRLKYWLEFHIFLCTLGPMLILFHTAFKFGGIVSISFWSMVLVVLSGVIGRFIYIQIPRTIEGRELSLLEAKEMKKNISDVLKNAYHVDDKTIEILSEKSNSTNEYQNKNILAKWWQNSIDERKTIHRAKQFLLKSDLTKPERKQILNLIKEEISLNHKIDRLLVMQSLFKHWHVVHLPFALIMLIIMVIHVAVTITFGYKWIF
jgi:hypothetical protein